MAKEFVFRKFEKAPRRTSAHRMEVENGKKRKRVGEKVAALNMKGLKGVKYTLREDEQNFYIMAETTDGKA